MNVTRAKLADDPIVRITPVLSGDLFVPYGFVPFYVLGKWHPAEPCGIGAFRPNHNIEVTEGDLVWLGDGRVGIVSAIQVPPEQG